MAVVVQSMKSPKVVAVDEIDISISSDVKVLGWMDDGRGQALSHGAADVSGARAGPATFTSPLSPCNTPFDSSHVDHANTHFQGGDV